MSLSNTIKSICKNYYSNKAINIIEAGCWNGEDSIALCQIFPNAKIFGFEPDIRQYKYLSELSQKYPNFIFNNMGLSNKDGKADFYLGSNQSEAFGSSSILDPNVENHKRIHNILQYNDIVSINTISLDSWANHNNITKLDFVWLDLQGAEGLVIKDSNIIKTTDIIYSEVNLVEIYKDAMLYREYKEMLNNLGFDVIIEQLPWEDAGNVLFVKNNIKKQIIDISTTHIQSIHEEGANIIYDN